MAVRADPPLSPKPLPTKHKLRGHFGLERVVPVGDRGLPVEVRIKRLNRHPGLSDRVARAAGVPAGRDPMNWRTVPIVWVWLTGRSRDP